MFLQNLAIAAKQVGILYIIVAVGFICDKTGLFKEKTARLSNDLLFYIITPAVIVTAFMSMDNTPENYKKLLLAFVFAVVFVPSFLLCFVVVAFALICDLSFSPPLW